MKLTKRGPVWWVDFRTPSGKRRRLSTELADEAAAYTRAGQIVSEHCVSPATVDKRASLSAALETAYTTNWLNSRSGTVMRRVVDKLKVEFAGVAVVDASTKSMRAYCERWLRPKAEGGAGIKPATVNRRMSAVGVALTLAVENGDLTVRPKLPHYAERNIVERYMSPDEEAAALGWLDRHIQALEIEGKVAEGEEWRYVATLARFLLDTGFRFSEAFKFTVDTGQAVLLANVRKNNKGGRVPLTPRANSCAKYLLASPIHRNLMVTDTKKAWDWVSHRWRRAVQSAGCPDVTLHILRHTCASRLVQAGIPIFTVSKWLGHSSVRVTERYASLAPDSLAAAVSVLTATSLEGSLHGTQQLPLGRDSTERGTVN